eukprot:374189-Rhodomonas_salina.1
MVVYGAAESPAASVPVSGRLHCLAKASGEEREAKQQNKRCHRQDTIVPGKREEEEGKEEVSLVSTAEDEE